MNAGISCVDLYFDVEFVGKYNHRGDDEEVKNENKTSYKKIIMVFLKSKSSLNCLFSSHQTIDGQ